MAAHNSAKLLLLEPCPAIPLMRNDYQGDGFIALNTMARVCLHTSPDPLARYYATHLLGSGARECATTANTEGLIEALHDPEPAIALYAYTVLEICSPELLERIDGEIIRSHGPSDSYTDSPEFDIQHYVYAMGLDRAAQKHLFYHLQHHDLPHVGKGASIDSIIPIHSLADFQPYEEFRQPIMQRRYEAIKAMVNEDRTNREEVLAMALNASDEDIAVVELGSGKRYLLQGHHRLAALYKSARDGAIPREWLDHLPLNVSRYTGDMPEALSTRILTLGVDLTWDDLIPPDPESSI